MFFFFIFFEKPIKQRISTRISCKILQRARSIFFSFRTFIRVFSRNISKVNSNDSSLAYSPNLHGKLNLKVSSRATIKSKKKKFQIFVLTQQKKRNTLNLQRQTSSIPFQRCYFFFLLPLLFLLRYHSYATLRNKSRDFSGFSSRNQVIHEIKFKKFLRSLIASNSHKFQLPSSLAFSFSFFPPRHEPKPSQSNIIGIEFKKLAQRGEIPFERSGVKQGQRGKSIEDRGERE